MKVAEGSEPLILAIETATRAGSVAIVRGDQLLSSMPGDAAASHSTNLIEMIEKVLTDADAKLADVELFAVAVGPGSFTGLRIGLATIKSFAVCTARGCVGISTLAAIAHAAGEAEQTVSLLPAGRGEVFAQLFSVSKGSVKALDAAAHITPQALLEKYGAMPQLKWAGDGAHQQVDVLRSWARAHDIGFAENQGGAAGWALASQSDNLAASVAALALNDSGNPVGPEALRAVYVRASDAEINERWQQEKARLSVQN